MNNKVIVFFLIFAFIICAFSTNSFATTITLSNDLQYDLDFSNVDFKSNYCIFAANSGGQYVTFDLITWDEPSSLYFTNSLRYLSSGTVYRYTRGYMETSFTFSGNSASGTFSSPPVYCSNVDLGSQDGSIVYYKSNGGNLGFQNPSFITSNDALISGDFDYLQIDAGDFDYADDVFYFNIYEGIPISDDLYDYTPKKSFNLNSYSDYMHANDLQITYDIPKVKLGISFDTGKRYLFQLSDSTGSSGNTYNEIAFTVSERTNDEVIKDNQDIINDKLDDQTNAIKESNETNKGIWETIKDILSYINPFSENFFVYKLIDLLVNALKSLFIPSNDFLSTYFTDLKNWFSDRLGFLFYPFELIIDVLNKMLNIDFSNPVFNIPNISEPFTGQKLISATTYNLNSILETEAFKTIHDIYLVIVDAFIIFGLVNLFRKKWEEVTNK